MGSGKTSAMINHINASDENTRFLYITPYLTEVARIISKCPQKAFMQPEVYGTKIQGIKYLFERGINIVSTHSLFRKFDEEIIDLAYNNNYVLVMDEVADVIEPLAISKFDLTTILNEYTEIVDGHLLRWTAREYRGEFEKYKRLCDLECMGIYNNRVILWLFPISTFKGFKEIYILTYLFQAQTQKYYFDFYNVDYNYLYLNGNSAETYSLSDDKVEYDYSKYMSLIHIFDNAKLNQIGDLEGSLSSSWYARNKGNALMTTLKNNIGNFFKNYTKTKTQYNLWTTFKEYEPVLSGKGYTKGYLPSNMRATNDYNDRTAVAYCINKYFNPYIKNFFVVNDIDIDEDAFALSEMIQWLFRSAIREDKAIDAYIPSKRMRELLIQWLYNPQY
jgi:hypothetical protein